MPKLEGSWLDIIAHAKRLWLAGPVGTNTAIPGSQLGDFTHRIASVSRMSEQGVPMWSCRRRSLVVTLTDGSTVAVEACDDEVSGDWTMGWCTVSRHGRQAEAEARARAYMDYCLY